jgi:hypothetical protein
VQLNYPFLLACGLAGAFSNLVHIRRGLDGWDGGDFEIGRLGETR